MVTGGVSGIAGALPASAGVVGYLGLQRLVAIGIARQIDSAGTRSSADKGPLRSAAQPFPLRAISFWFQKVQSRR